MLTWQDAVHPPSPFLHIFLCCWPDPSGVEGSVSPSVNFGGLYTSSYLHVINMQITFCFILVPFYPCIVAV